MRKIWILAGAAGFALGVGVTLCVQARPKATPPPQADARHPTNDLIVGRYDVSDLIVPFIIPPSNTSNNSNQNPQAGYGSAGDYLVSFIQETVAPESWRKWIGPSVTDGRVARAVGGHIFVVQTQENQLRIQRLLKDLRAVRVQPIPAVATPNPAANLPDGWTLSDVPAALEAKMRMTVDDLDFNKTPIQEAVAILAHRYGVTIRMDGAVLDQDEMSKVAVTIRLRNMPLTDALGEVLRAAALKNKLSFGVAGGEVLITDNENAALMTISRVYDIRDLVPSQPSRDQVIENVANTLCDSIAPESWRAAGGTVGEIHDLDGVLIITHTWQVQEEIRVFLQRLRKGGVRFTPTTQPANFPMVHP